MTFFESFIKNFTVTQELEFFLRIIAASVCGALIGFERTKRFKEAGIRTHILVACASALMMLVSKYGFADLYNNGAFFPGTDGADASRIASQVVTGISFLGAGVVFKLGTSVKGLTTAAGIWATSGIGLAIGAGMYFEGIFVTALVLLSQFLMHKVTVGKDSVETVTVMVTVKSGEQFKNEFSQMAKEKNIRLSYTSVCKNPGGTITYRLNITIARKSGLDALIELAETDDNIISFKHQIIN
jgi:putative Mg2+ transporter-C (MgtC) family protein